MVRHLPPAPSRRESENALVFFSHAIGDTIHAHDCDPFACLADEDFLRLGMGMGSGYGVSRQKCRRRGLLVVQGSSRSRSIV